MAALSYITRRGRITRKRAATRVRALLFEQFENRCLLAVIPPSGLVSWYRAENNTADAAGSNPGTATNGATYVAGKVGQAFSLDGQDDYINVPDSNSLDLISTAITVDAWIKPQTSPNSSFGTLLARRDPQVSEGYSIFVTNAGELQIFLRTTATNNVARFTTDVGVIDFGQFQHLATTYDSATKSVKAYRNGVPLTLSAVDGPVTGPLVNVGHLFIGEREDTAVSDAQAAGHFYGAIDDLHIFNRALTFTEIASIYSAGGDGLATIVVNTTADTTSVSGNGSAITPGPSVASSLAPFGGSNDFRYQQIYSASMFGSVTAPVEITALRFSPDTGDDEPGTYAADLTVSLNATSVSVAGLSSNLDSNITGQLTPVLVDHAFSADTIGGDLIYGFRLDVSAAHFVYDPTSDKNLLMEINVKSKSSQPTFFRGEGQGVTARAYIDSSNPTPFTDQRGLRTLIEYEYVPRVSLRDAITKSNVSSNGREVVGFAIPGTGVQTINLLSALPAVTSPILIDGGTQPGFSGTPIIELNGAGITAGTAHGLQLNAGASTVKALAINGFSGNGIRIDTKDGNTILGSYIGTDSTGTVAKANSLEGVRVQTANNLIGGVGSQQRNIISGNLKDGVIITGASAKNNTVVNSYIGVDATGANAVPNGNNGVNVQAAASLNTIGTNGDGISDLFERNVIAGNLASQVIFFGANTNNNVLAGNFIGTNASGTAAMPSTTTGVQVNTGASFNRVGTDGNGISDAAERNLISGNGVSGIALVGSTGNLVAGNSIGTDVTGTAALANGFEGIRIRGGATANTIGGSGSLTNIIAYNKAAGIGVIDAGTINNFIGQNSIYGNGGLAIDLNENGATTNDAADADTGPNNLQNFPVISYATLDAGKLKVTYNVPSEGGNSTYPIRVEFFAADADGQEGQTFLTFDTFTQANHVAGSKTITLPVSASIKVLDKIVATATDSLTAALGGGPANTSEFSPSTTIVSPWQNRNPGRLQWDVNDDKFVSADDVVGVINYINAKGSGVVPDNAANQKPYVDVDGDNNVVAMDVVDIINYINAGRRLGGEAESSSLTPPATSAPDDATLLTLLAADVVAQARGKRRNP